MWARVVEIMLGVWLMASPIFIDAEGGVTSFICGLLAASLGLLSFRERTVRSHLLTVVVGAWLVISGYLAGSPAPGQAQNQIIVGLLLVMFAIIPSHADEIPNAWKEHYRDKRPHAESRDADQ